MLGPEKWSGRCATAVERKPDSEMVPDAANPGFALARSPEKDKAVHCGDGKLFQ
jgi:hypothetical protein